ncbi:MULTISPECIES: hypothetical protein [unclassified Sinorhizobium]|uniref:hypothetical protein n=1 Tax=unclassified Sinorhizobium TaxID=2613772 RepID=UPI003523AFCB
MSGLEAAIRNALERSDRANPEVRARIYQSARQALEAGLRKQDITDVDTVSTQRQRLEATIRTIEGEERARLHASVVPPVVEMRPPATPPAQARDEDAMAVRGETRGRSEPNLGNEHGFGDMRAERADQPGSAPTAASQPASGRSAAMDFRPEAAAVRRKPRKFFSRLLLWCVLLAFIGMGAWWVYTSGLLLSPAERDTSVANPPARTEPEDFTGREETNDQNNQTGGGGQLATIDPQNGFSAEWIEVFKPTDASKIVSGAQAKVENISENDGAAVRLTSQSSAAEGNLAIEIPANVLQQLAGKTSTFALTLQATSDSATQITVQCDFQTLGDCDRHRFNVAREKSDALFQVRFDRSMAPTSPGRLIINSDVDGKARGINLFAIRVLPGQ